MTLSLPAVIVAMFFIRVLPKHQIASIKSQINSNDQNQNHRMKDRMSECSFGHWDLEVWICLGFGTWDLGFHGAC
jgi:hypothetical protein